MGKRLFYSRHTEALVMKARCEPVYFGDESKKIIQGDALTELKKLPSESIDLILPTHLITSGKTLTGW